MEEDKSETSEQASLPRLSKLGYPVVRKKPVGGPKELTAKHRLLIDYMVNGCPHDFVRHLSRTVMGEVVPIEPGQPLSLNEAADLVRIRRRHARELSTFPIFQRAMAASVQALRNGAAAKAMQTVIGLVSEEGQGKAADRKVQLAASMFVLGETGGSSAPQVNVNVGIQANISPGYIVKPPSRSATVSALINESDGQTIDHDDEVNE